MKPSGDSAKEAAGRARFDAGALAAFRALPGAPPAGLMAGIDEAGRGPLAGPVVAAAVILPPGLVLEDVNDSKQLSAARREAAFERIGREALGVGVGMASAEEIDALNILEATRLAARRAVAALPRAPNFLLLDALRLPGEARPQEGPVRGDARSQSIAAASIIAKVTRDRLMERYDAEYPEYGFARHKGYGTAEHLRVLREIGPSALHRLTFGGVCFFDQAYRRSRSFHSIEAQLVADNLTAMELKRALARIRELDGFLPDRETQALRTLAGRREARGEHDRQSI